MGLLLGEQHIWQYPDAFLPGWIHEEDIGTHSRVEAGDDIRNDVSLLEGHGDVGQIVR